jgi:hypothetical protein
MMTAYRGGRTVCLMMTQTEHADSYESKVEWEVFAPGEIAPGGQT